MSPLLRYSAGTGIYWTVPALGTVEVVSLTQSDPLFVQWTTTVDMINGVYILLVPVAAGIACALTVPVARRWQLVVVAPDSGLRAVVWQVLLVGTVCTAVHVVTMVAVVAIGYVKDIPSHPSVFPVLATVASLYAASAFGVFVARLAPSPISAPFCVVFLYLLEIFLPRMVPDPFLDFGGATSVLLGLQNRYDVVASQTLWLMVVAAGLALATAHGLALATLTRLAVPLALLLIGATALLASRGDERFEEVAAEYVCSEGDPQVCVTREYKDSLALYEQRVTRFHMALFDLGLRSLPDSYRQAVGTGFPSGGSFNVSTGAPLEQSAFEALASAFSCSPGWSARQLEKTDIIVAYLVKGPGERLYPGAPVAHRGTAIEALDALSCD